MDSRKQKEYYYDDEIDLYELWLRIKKRWKVILLTVLIGTGLGFAYSLTATKIYRSEGVLRIGYDPIFLIGDIDIDIDIDQSSVNPMLITSAEELSKLVLNFKGPHGVSISVEKNRRAPAVVTIVIEARSPEIIPLAFEELIAYLKNSTYFAKKIGLARQELVSLRNKLKESFNKMMEQQRLLEKRAYSGDVVAASELVKINRLISDTFRELSRIDFLLENMEPFYVVTKPSSPDLPAKPKKKLIVAVAFVSSLFLGLFLALFLDWVGEARSRHQGSIQGS